jgi:glycosyltransferase involved in cell wall biosynthesis
VRILVITQYFWPENLRINDVCLGLKENGHEVIVLTGKPNYPSGDYFNGYSWKSKNLDEWNNIKIYRSNLFLRKSGNGINLFLNYFSFALFASIKVFFIKEKFDKIFVYAPSPATVGIPGIIAKKLKKAKLYYWVHDLWPESIKIAGNINYKFILSTIDYLVRYIYKKSDKILIQSKGFKTYLLRQNVLEKKIIYYPYSAEDLYKRTEPKHNYKQLIPSGFTIMFAGNIGESQSFDTLLQTARYLKDKKIKVTWIILGDGRLKKYVKEKIIELDIEDIFLLLGSFPVEEMPDFFACADALLISLKKSPIFSLTLPGKLQSYMACGKPLIGSLDGEGARIIQEANAGFVAPAENTNSLAEIIEKIYNLTEGERFTIGENARAFFEKEFERQSLLSKLESIFELA